MKKFVSISLFLFFFTLQSNAQYLDGKPLSELDVPYIQMLATSKLLKPFQVTISINYGQVGTMKEVKKQFVYEDESMKKSYPFNGVMGAINHIHKLGYELVNAFPSNAGNQNVYHYYFKKM